MIANFVLYGLFVIGWFVVIVVFLISDCRKTDDERKKKKSIKCYVIFSVIILIPSLPLYLLAGNERPLSCAPNLRCITDNDSGCDAVERVRFGMLIVLGFFLILLTAFTACCKLHLMFIRKRKAKEQKCNGNEYCMSLVIIESCDCDFCRSQRVWYITIVTSLIFCSSCQCFFCIVDYNLILKVKCKSWDRGREYYYYQSSHSELHNLY